MFIIVFTEDNEGYELKFDAYCKFPDGYTLRDSQQFRDISDAKKHCDEMTDCTMFYTYKDGIDKFNICPPGSVVDTSYKGSRMYIKGESMHYITTFCTTIC